MDINLKLDRLAIHFIDKKNDRLELSQQEKNVSGLPETIKRFLMNLVEIVWEAPDTGSNRSAHFYSGEEKRFASSIVEDGVTAIIEETGDFFTISTKFAEHLYKQSPRNASPGLLAVYRLVSKNTEQAYVALLKIRPTDESFVKILEEELTQLAVEEITNLLQKEVQKGALVPHPLRPEYDLKIVDRQLKDDPAEYFSLDFVGSVPKKSDVHQAKSLLAEIQAYAHIHDVRIADHKLPGLIASLRGRETEITSEDIIYAVEENMVFDEDYDQQEFVGYLESKENLGSINIQPLRFDTRGKRGKIKRKFKYIFTDPNYHSVEISGPPEILEKIIRVNGDTVTFEIQTTKNGYKVNYE